MQQPRQFPPVPGYPEVLQPPPIASIVKTILFVSSLLMSLGGTVIAISAIHFAVSEDKLSYKEDCFYIEYHDDDDDKYEYRRSPYTDCWGEDNKAVKLVYALIPLILQLVVFVSLGCMSCCCVLENHMFGVYLSILVPTIGTTFILGRAITSSRELSVMIVAIGCAVLFAGNLLLIIVISFKDRPLLSPAFLWREWGSSDLPQAQQTQPFVQGQR